MARWLELLSQYNFQIQHRAGVKHGNADALSRFPSAEEECTCYDGPGILEHLPCGGCETCQKKHLQWSPFLEVDDVVPLTSKKAALGVSQSWGERVGNCPEMGHVLDYVQWIAFWLVWAGGQALRMLGLPLLLTTVVLQKPLIGLRAYAVQPPGRTGNSWVDGYTPDQMAEEQAKDPDLVPVIQWLKAGARPSRDGVAGCSPTTRNLWLQYDQLVLHQGVLYRTMPRPGSVPAYQQLVVPRALQDDVLHALHNSLTGAHLGVKKTLSRLKAGFYWFAFKDSVKTWIRKCLTCAARKRPHRTPRAPLRSYHVGAPMDRVAMDITVHFLSVQGGTGTS